MLTERDCNFHVDMKLYRKIIIEIIFITLKNLIKLINILQRVGIMFKLLYNCKCIIDSISRIRYNSLATD